MINKLNFKLTLIQLVMICIAVTLYIWISQAEVTDMAKITDLIDIVKAAEPNGTLAEECAVSFVAASIVGIAVGYIAGIIIRHLLQ